MVGNALAPSRSASTKKIPAANVCHGAVVDRLPRELFDARFRERPIVVVRHRLAADAEDGELLGEEPVEQQVVERRQQLAMDEIAGASENDDGHWFLTACPHVRRTAGRAMPAGVRRTDRDVVSFRPTVAPPSD